VHKKKDWIDEKCTNKLSCFLAASPLLDMCSCQAHTVIELKIHVRMEEAVVLNSLFLSFFSKQPIRKINYAHNRKMFNGLIGEGLKKCIPTSGISL